MRELLEKYKDGVMAVLFFAAMAFAVTQTARIVWAKKDLLTATVRLEAAQERLVFRDAQIAAIVSAAAARDTASSKALISAKNATATAAARAQALQSEAVPADCAGAVAWAASRGKSAGAW